MVRDEIGPRPHYSRIANTSTRWPISGISYFHSSDLRASRARLTPNLANVIKLPVIKERVFTYPRKNMITFTYEPPT